MFIKEMVLHLIYGAKQYLTSFVKKKFPKVS